MTRFNRLVIAAFTFAVLALASASHAQADTIIIGNNSRGTSDCAPFSGCYNGFTQQVYSAGNFSGPITITQVGFQVAGSFNGNVTIGLSTTTTATPSSMSMTYADNRGADYQTVFSGPVSSTTAGNGGFNLFFNLTTPFTYNPALGNLLMDIHVNSATLYASNANFSDSNTGRIFGSNDSGVTAIGAQTNYGLYTSISSNQTATPEPATIVMFGTGLLGVGAMMRRRRRTSDER